MFDKEEVKNAVVKANCALELERRIAGVKFLFTQKEFDQADSPQLKSKMRYCGMVEHAMRGQNLKADFENFGCFGGGRALGIVEREEFYLNGRFFSTRGLYHDLSTSKEVSTHIAGCRHRAYGVEIKPVEEFVNEPDVVIIVTNPNNIMRLVQGYTYHFGTHGTYKMIGNQALCAECTAHPYESNDINMSVLCAGPRSVGMNDTEMAVGMPFNKFVKVIDGLCMTITPVEQNKTKEKIIERLKQNNVTDVTVHLNRNYGKPFFNRDYAYFSQQREKNPMEEEELLPDIWKEE